MGQNKKTKIYAVARGKQPGIYEQWFGSTGAEAQVKGFPKARFKGFESRQAATDWLETQRAQSEATSHGHHSISTTTGGRDALQTADVLAPLIKDMAPTEEKPGVSKAAKRTPKPRKSAKDKTASGSESPKSRSKHQQTSAEIPSDGGHGNVTVYTDGGAINNPGPGGYGAVLIYGEHKKELSGGYRLTTNNRMELMACIAGLQMLKRPCSVTLFSDSQYVVNGITKGWAKKWRSKGWMRTRTEQAANADLWDQLLTLTERHTVTFRWVKGHAGNPGNERCDVLATQAARRQNLPVDLAYEELAAQA